MLLWLTYETCHTKKESHENVCVYMVLFSLAAQSCLCDSTSLNLYKDRTYNVNVRTLVLSVKVVLTFNL